MKVNKERKKKTVSKTQEQNKRKKERWGGRREKDDTRMGSKRTGEVCISKSMRRDGRPPLGMGVSQDNGEKDIDEGGRGRRAGAGSSKES